MILKPVVTLLISTVQPQVPPGAEDVLTKVQWASVRSLPLANK